MNAKFETSLGWVKGVIEGKYFYPDIDGDKILSRLHYIDEHTIGHEIKGEWVKIELKNSPCGEPEYKLIKSPIK